jgi:FkbM family methyltransferase
MEKSPRFRVLNFLLPRQDYFFLRNWKIYKDGTGSASQLGQEFLPKIYGISTGFFVEVGANDGLTFSNTRILESLGWSGVLIEPDPRNLDSLRKNRNSVILPFCATNADGVSVNLSLAEDSLYSSSFTSAKDITSGIKKTYKVKGFTLTSMLDRVDAPTDIALMTIDVEGDELGVLDGLDLEKYNIKIICIEHNYNKANLETISSIMKNSGYSRIYKVASQFDAWFVKSNEL